MHIKDTIDAIFEMMGTARALCDLCEDERGLTVAEIRQRAVAKAAALKKQLAAVHGELTGGGG